MAGSRPCRIAWRPAEFVNRYSDRRLGPRRIVAAAFELGARTGQSHPRHGLLDHGAPGPRDHARRGDAWPRVCLTLAWAVEEPALAFEGNIRSAGSTLIWAAELLGVDTQELARIAATARDSRGVYVVPAFGGLVVGRIRDCDGQRVYLWRDTGALRPGGPRFDRSPDRRRP